MNSVIGYIELEVPVETELSKLFNIWIQNLETKLYTRESCGSQSSGNGQKKRGEVPYQ